VHVLSAEGGYEMKQSDFELVFQKAAAREAEAYRFYRDVAEKTGNEAVKEIFLELAKQEKGHEELMWKFKGDATMELKFKAPTDYKIAETVEVPEPTADMKPADAIALAMKREQRSVELYRGLADGCADAELKKIFENLANMESGHKHKLENLFVDIGYPEVW
jgi:rubrerythrin